MFDAVAVLHALAATQRRDDVRTRHKPRSAYQFDMSLSGGMDLRGRRVLDDAGANQGAETAIDGYQPQYQGNHCPKPEIARIRLQH